MDIFRDVIDLDEVDFTCVMNEDGEWEELEEMSWEDLTNFICALERQIKMLPEHENAPIWEEYLYRSKRVRKELE